MYLVVCTLDCSVWFQGTYEECQSYLDEYPEHAVFGTLTVESEESYDRIMSEEDREDSMFDYDVFGCDYTDI